MNTERVYLAAVCTSFQCSHVHVLSFSNRFCCTLEWQPWTLAEYLALERQRPPGRELKDGESCDSVNIPMTLLVAWLSDDL